MSIQKRGTGRSAKYIVRWYESGKERSRSFSLKRDAQAFDAERRAASLRGETIGVHGVGSRGQLLLKDVVKEWMNSALNDGTKDARKVLFNNLGPLGDMRISEIRRSDIQSWVSDLHEGRPWANGEPFKPSTTKVVSTALRGVFNQLVDDGILASSPAKKVAVPKSSVSIQKGDIPSAEEVAQMVKAAERYGESLPAMVVLSAATGLRSGEVAGLTRKSLDRDSMKIHVTHQMSKKGFLAPPKTLTSIRSIPVGESVFELLEPFSRGIGDNDLLFRKEKGRFNQWAPWTSPSISDAINRLKKRGLIGDFHFHSLRHYFASVMLDRGVNIRALQEMMGHTSVTTTLEIYVHVMPSSDDTVRSGSAEIMRDIYGI